MKTKIVDENGQIPPIGPLFFRRYIILWAIAYVPFVGGFIGLLNPLFIFGKEKRCIHDYLAGTYVIDISER